MMGVNIEQAVERAAESDPNVERAQRWLSTMTQETPAERVMLAVAELIESKAAAMDCNARKMVADIQAKTAEARTVLLEQSSQIVKAQLEQGWAGIRLEGNVVCGHVHFTETLPDGTEGRSRSKLTTWAEPGQWVHDSYDVGDYELGQAWVKYVSEPGVVPTPERVARDMQSLIQDGGGGMEVDLRTTATG